MGDRLAWKSPPFTILHSVGISQTECVPGVYHVTSGDLVLIVFLGDELKTVTTLVLSAFQCLPFEKILNKYLLNRK